MSFPLHRSPSARQLAWSTLLVGLAAPSCAEPAPPVACSPCPTCSPSVLVATVPPAASSAAPSASAIASAAVDDAGPPRHALVDAMVLPVPPGPSGREYVLYVMLPASYADHPERRYPTVYVCDGYWDAALVRATYWNLAWDKVVPEFILVGFGYAGEKPDYDKLRRWDYTPVVDPPADGGAPDTGHAAEFLDTVEHQILPLVEREFRADPSYRVLAGSSLGGLFTLYVLLSRPALFQAYIAASPAVRFANEWLFHYEADFARAHGGAGTKARLFMTGAEKEWPDFVASIKRFDARLREHAYPGLKYQFRLIDGEHHAGTKAESYTRGLRFAFAESSSGAH